MERIMNIIIRINCSWCLTTICQLCILPMFKWLWKTWRKMAELAMGSPQHLSLAPHTSVEYQETFCRILQNRTIYLPNTSYTSPPLIIISDFICILASIQCLQSLCFFSTVGVGKISNCDLFLYISSSECLKRGPSY